MTRRRRGVGRRTWRGTVLLAALLASSAVRAAEDGAVAVASGFNEVLLGSMREADALGYAGRYQRLKPAVERTFDVPFMAEKVLGRRWDALSEADRARWRELFAELLAATYAGRFVGYRGQHFETHGEEPAARDTVLVSTRLVDPKGDDVDIDYRLRKTEGGWRVVDVYLKGTVSELALRRSEYSAVLERDGFAGLVDAVEARIDALERGEDAPS